MNCAAVITDWSSIAIEAALTGVPVLYVRNRDCESAFLPAVTDILHSYYQGAAAADMVEFVAMVTGGDDPKKEARQAAVKKCLPYTDGFCGQRMADDIYCGLTEAESPAKTRVILFGTGMVFSSVCNYPLREDIEVVAISDNNSKKWGTEINGYKVVPPYEIQDQTFDVLVIMANTHHSEEIQLQLHCEYEIPFGKIKQVDSFMEMCEI
jgi:FlaA1/EpsC-like NDP-sugar epimerase